MHPNPAFRQEPAAAALAFAAARGFGTLAVNGGAVNGAAGPLLAHVPFLMAEGDGAALVHLARSNAIARQALPCPAVLSVLGPDAYVSPDWYGAPDQVPTWNYVAVHLRGRLEPLPEAALQPMVEALSDLFEARLAPKRPWRSAKLGPGVMERMLRMIVPFRLVVEGVESTFKLGQNKTPPMRAGVIAALAAAPDEGPAAGVARLMAGLADHP